MDIIFEHKDYKKYINSYIKNQPKKGYGLKQAFANAAQCQIGYVSQVLNGDRHFSSEQVTSIAKVMGLNDQELEYLLLLLGKARAGTPELEKFYLQLIAEKQKAHANLRQRIQISESLSIEDQAYYYSKWYIGAIHMLVTIPEFRTLEKVADYMDLPLKTVREVLEFLVSRSFLESHKNEYRVKGPFLHLEKGSPLLISHHTNWRVQAIQAMANEGENDLHFSACFTLAEEDVKKIRAKLSNYIEELSSVIKPSKEEKMCCLNFDYFEV